MPPGYGIIYAPKDAPEELESLEIVQFVEAHWPTMLCTMVQQPLHPQAQIQLHLKHKTRHKMLQEYGIIRVAKVVREEPEQQETVLLVGVHWLIMHFTTSKS